MAEDKVDAETLASPVILNMCQGEKATQLLRKVENEGGFIINQPGGVLNCHRHNRIPILQKAGIPFPQSFVVETENANGIPADVFAFNRLWIKRGDNILLQRGDDRHEWSIAGASGKAAYPQWYGQLFREFVHQIETQNYSTAFLDEAANALHCVTLCYRSAKMGKICRFSNEEA